MEINETVVELRQKLQEPRKAVDTWYGRHVMRRFSVYITRWLLRFDWTPNRATLLSLGLGLVGVLALGLGCWGSGILFLNLWYLVDHVDGEIARYTGKSSLSGYFFDTVVNFFVQPFTFLAIGLGLHTTFFLAAGFFAMFGNLMLGLIPMCEDSILLQVFRKKGVVSGTVAPAPASQSVPSFWHRAFSTAHFWMTYPSFLCLFTGAYVVLGITTLIDPKILMGFFLTMYALIVTVVWVGQLVHKILSRKLDEVIA